MGGGREQKPQRKWRSAKITHLTSQHNSSVVTRLPLRDSHSHLATAFPDADPRRRIVLLYTQTNQDRPTTGDFVSPHPAPRVVVEIASRTYIPRLEFTRLFFDLSFLALVLHPCRPFSLFPLPASLFTLPSSRRRRRPREHSSIASVQQQRQHRAHGDREAQ